MQISQTESSLSGKDLEGVYSALNRVQAVIEFELDGTIIGQFGRAGKAPGEFATIHQMDCRDPDVIDTAEINNWRSQKILLRPQAMKTSSQQ